MYSATHESLTVAHGQRKKILTALRTNQITGFVTVPSEKKKKKDHLDDLNYIRIVYWYRFT